MTGLVKFVVLVALFIVTLAIVVAALVTAAWLGGFGGVLVFIVVFAAAGFAISVMAAEEQSP